MEDIAEIVLSRIRGNIETQQSEREFELPYTSVEKNKISEANYVDKVLARLPKKYNSFYSKLISRLNLMNDFTIDWKSREITIGNTFFPDSDIVKLLRLLNGNGRGIKTVGSEGFFAFLKDHDLDEFIRNPFFKKGIRSDITSEASKSKNEITNEKDIAKKDNIKRNTGLKYIPKWYCIALIQNKNEKDKST